jgi:hypothetical protein
MEKEKRKYMSYLEKLMNQLVEGGSNRIIANPETIKKLREKGIPIKKGPQKTIEESIEILFSERKKLAIDLVKKLPDAPNVAAPAIESLYNEILECIIFGLNGAAITLSGILVEFVLKYTIVVKETGGFKYDAQLWDKIESITLAPTINRANKAGLISGEEAKKLNDFKDYIRNPYNHYNIKRITSSAVWQNVKKLNIETQEVEEVDIAAKDDPVVQAQVKPYIDKQRALEIFEYANQLIKILFSRI